MAIEETEAKVCKKCEKPLAGIHGARKFCSALCRTRFFALKRYYDIKGTDKYKAQRKVYERNWRENNREKWNERMRIAAKKYRDKNRKSNLKTSNEGMIGQPSGASIETSAGQGAIAGIEGNDQPSNLDPNQGYQNHTLFVGEPIQQPEEEEESFNKFKTKNNYETFE